MRNSKLMWSILKRTGTVKLTYGYLALLLFISVSITFVEPKINNIGDGLWYCFSVITTIGFGDYIATTLIGRALSVVLSVYSIIMIALIPGVITSYYIESIKVRSNESMEKFLYDLERLPELSKEELEELSEKVKKFHKRNINKNKK